ncbi:MAG: nucleotidyl transferase AbiEii/AbiGii toxin family protein [Deltaproteobacteria bacterium]|nr:nucleotidyl transferase AbiEii/AbiGii toxin family protein [Deltaproteobacteria bacterium]
MGSSPKDILSPLQWEFLSLFFQGAPPFFLTGGTALSAFYLQHRYSEDLDLFTLTECLSTSPIPRRSSTPKPSRYRPRHYFIVTGLPGMLIP